MVVMEKTPKGLSKESEKQQWDVATVTLGARDHADRAEGHITCVGSWRGLSRKFLSTPNGFTIHPFSSVQFRLSE